MQEPEKPILRYSFLLNTTLEEETIITNVVAGEVITLSEKQFILSKKSERIFGNDFNFKWPRLAPGINNFIITIISFYFCLR